ncbi:MAG: hydantoinase B/oxoprolinase family protein [Desulfobacteraceae bacterium]|nr:hydantoinase B/oxoprolinase family protein [Desulfobacteraceae bacterium]
MEKEQQTVVRDAEIKTNPILLEVIRNYLITTCREMGIAMMRTSYSPMFNEALDFTCVIFDGQGEMVGQAEFVPAQIGAIVHTVEWAIKEVGPENMEPGDVILHNDPYRGGCHLPEFMVLKPFFYEDKIVAYTANIAHMTDVGGMVPACFGDTRNIFQEGLRLPPVKIYRRDQENADIFRIIISNVRTPRNSYGDLKAMIGSIYLGERRLKELVEKYGLEEFEQCAEDIKNVSEVLMRKAILAMPDGETTFEGYIEDDGVIPDRPWKIKGTLVVREDEIIADYTGSDPQAAGAINQSFGVTASATYNAIFHILGEDIPFNHGCYRPISIVTEPGTITNVDYPGSCVGGNSDTYPTTVDILLAGFSQISDRSSAADGGTCGLVGLGGVNPDNGEAFAHLHLDGVGWGARNDHDGNDNTFVKNGNCANTPVEVYETRYPVLIKEYSLAVKQGAPGVGRHRGGYGTRRIWQFLTPTTVSAHTNRLTLRPWGLFGGHDAGNQELKFRVGSSEEWKNAKEQFNTISLGKFSNVTMETGDEMLLVTAGGGGYGDPLERDPQLVLEDYVEELLTADEARDLYAVIIDEARREIDREGTARLRSVRMNK